MSNNFAPIFETLREFFKEHAGKCVVLHDDASRYFLGSHEVRAKDGYRTGFGGVEIKKAYVSVHLMPVYIYPDLLENLSTNLQKRMQGKSCFNFKKEDAQLFDELNTLIKTSISRFESSGRL